MPKHIVITGAGSAIAQAVARRYAAGGASFFLVDRNAELVNAVAADLRVRGAAAVVAKTQDLAAFDNHVALVAQAVDVLGQIDVCLIAHGTLPDQRASEQSWSQTYDAFVINELSAISFIMAVVPQLMTQNTCTLAVIGSVAGDRGRQSNYTYGAAKGGLAIYLQGLRHHLASTQVKVLTIKPGLVDTPMTATFKKGLMWVKPDRVAKDIVRAIDNRRDVIYTPGRWRWIMLIIRLIPEKLFKKTQL